MKDKRGGLGFSERGLITVVDLFCEVQKCHLMQDLEYLIQILKFCEKKLTKVVPGGVMGATLWKV